MRFRQEKNPAGDEAERALEAEVRRMVSGSGTSGVPEPPDLYWQNLAVRANAQIDGATSGKALSILWAARVAIPGVVAIVSFFIGLHYYVPEPPREDVSVAAVVLSLPATAIDSLLLHPERMDPSFTVQELGVDVSNVSREQIADYLVVSGNTSAAVDGLTEREASVLLAALGTDTR
jgi:hypothetical protein